MSRVAYINIILLFTSAFSIDWLISYYEILPYYIIYVNDILIASLFSLSCGNSLLTGRFRCDKEFLCIFLFLVSSFVISFAINEVPLLNGIAGIRRFLLPSFVAISLYNLALNRKYLEKIFRFVLFLLAIQPAVAIGEFTLALFKINPTKISLIDSALGTFGTKNGSATICAFMIFLFFYFFYSDRKVFSLKNVYIGTAFFLAFSGGSYYLFGMSLVLSLFLFSDVFRLKVILKLAFLSFLGLALLIRFGGPYIQPFFDIGRMIGHQQQYWSEARRYGDLASLKISMSKIEKPLARLTFGLGPGMFSETKISEQISPHVEEFSNQNLPSNENSLSLLLSEFGLVGSFLFLILISYVVVQCYMFYRKVYDKKLKRILFAFVGFGIVFVLGGIYRSYWISFPEQLFFWSLFGGFLSLRYNLRIRK